MPSPTVYAGEKTFGGFGKETSNGTAVAPTRFFPFTKFDPVNDPNLLIDEALDGSMAAERDGIPGVRQGSLDIATYMYADVVGDFLYNMLGGYAVGTAVNGVYPHTFSLLNGSDGQPPAHTITDNNGITATVGARAYPYACCSDLTFSGDATGLVTVEAKFVSYASAPAAAAPVNTVTSEHPAPGWRSTVNVGGSAAANVRTWSVTMSRTIMVVAATNGLQDPYALVRKGDLKVSGKLTYVAKDESPLTALMAGTSQVIAITIDETGGTGANLRTLALTMSAAKYDTGQQQRDTPIGWEMSFKGFKNTTDAGASGGTAPIKAVLNNLVTTY